MGIGLYLLSAFCALVEGANFGGVGTCHFWAGLPIALYAWVWHVGGC